MIKQGLGGFMSAALLSFAVRMVGAALGFALSLILGRLLGASGLGIYFSAIGLAVILRLVAGFGFDAVLVRYVAIAIDAAEPRRATALLLQALRTVGIAAAVIGTGFIVVAPLAQRLLPDTNALKDLPVQAIALLVLFMTLSETLAAGLRGSRQFIQSALVAAVLPRFIAIIVVLLIGQSLTAVDTLLAQSLGCFIALLTGLWVWRRHHTLSAQNADTVDLKDMMTSSRTLWSSQIITSGLIPWVPVLVLAAFASDADAGILGLAARFITLLRMFLSAINTVISPELAVRHKRGDLDGLKDLARKFAVVNTVFALVFIMLIGSFSDQLMGLAGPAFADFGMILIILLMGEMANAATGAAGFLLVMTGHESSVRKLTFFTLFVLILSCVILVPGFGIYGAAWATSIGVALQNLMLLYFCKRHLGFQTIHFSATIWLVQTVWQKIRDLKQRGMRR